MRLKISLLFVGLFLLNACEEKNDDKIHQAKVCLNTATPANVDNCVRLVEGISSSQAFQIRCSADFISANITESSIISALEELDKNTNTGNSATVVFFTHFKFNTPNQANQAVTNCEATGSSTLVSLALAAKSATIIGGLTQGKDLKEWVDDLTIPDIEALDEATLIELGQTVIDLEPKLCGPQGAFEGNKVCKDIHAAQASGQTLEEIAKRLINELKNPN